jgi:plasmid maintenance system antidote protein VapI
MYISGQGLTQAEFAKRAGMTQGNVSKLCGDNPKISKETALHIEAVTDGDVPVEVWPQFNFIARLRHDLKRGNGDAGRQVQPPKEGAA